MKTYNNIEEEDYKDIPLKKQKRIKSNNKPKVKKMRDK